MKYVATIHFESPTEPLDDADQFAENLAQGMYEVTDFNIEPVEDPAP